MRHLTAYRLSVRKFNKMCALGLFEDDKVELLNGVLTMMTSGPGHDYAVSYLARSLEKMLPENQFSVREEKPVELGRHWKPQPDIAVVRGVHRDFIARTPGAADIALIVEVSDTTYVKDTKIKLRRYERCGLPYICVVDLSRRRIEVREMGTQGLAEPLFYKDGDEAPVVLDSQEYGRIAVSDLLT